ncbi:anthranilate synthase beta subunit 2, chloroplastic-like isoform X3 [Carya illinoinensis]|uniref:anthranilate synthase beta subunit 2, chloroplastic-like isoform X3 n=1 Tax=Carya illinoinensis TaxID=32201 RepID=UPI001C718012|nr:anthranilate synthase beta subunit 2, chloroplastic-like isoform X3 [Carya illinoinensis]
MAASSLYQASLVQSEPSFFSRTVQTPDLFPHRQLSIPSSRAFLLKRQSGFVPKASLTAVSAQSNSNSSIPRKNPNNPIIVIDNYDSFTYNLCQYMGELGCDFEVYRNDEVTVEDLKRMNPRGILISPGPGKVVRAPGGVMHGKSSLVYYDEKEEDGLFSGLSNPFTAGRYHSLVVEKESFPSEELEITAWTEDGLIMAARHRKYKHLQGVQFHPESIISTEGKTIVRNFVKLIERKEAESHQT